MVICSFVELFTLIKKSEFIDRLSFFLLFIGLVSLIIALVTGNYALNLFKSISGDDQIVINKHIDYANYSAWFSSILFLLRIYFYSKIKKHNIIRLIIILISFITLFFVFKTGEYGGFVNEILINSRKGL